MSPLAGRLLLTQGAGMVGTNRDQYLCHHPIHGKNVLDLFRPYTNKIMFMIQSLISFKRPTLILFSSIRKTASQPLSCTKKKQQISKLLKSKARNNANPNVDISKFRLQTVQNIFVILRTISYISIYWESYLVEARAPVSVT